MRFLGNLIIHSPLDSPSPSIQHKHRPHNITCRLFLQKKSRVYKVLLAFKGKLRGFHYVTFMTIWNIKEGRLVIAVGISVYRLHFLEAFILNNRQRQREDLYCAPILWKIFSYAQHRNVFFFFSAIWYWCMIASVCFWSVSTKS
jgi:hypothetical protein